MSRHVPKDMNRELYDKVDKALKKYRTIESTDIEKDPACVDVVRQCEELRHKIYALRVGDEGEYKVQMKEIKRLKNCLDQLTVRYDTAKKKLCVQINGLEECAFLAEREINECERQLRDAEREELACISKVRSELSEKRKKLKGNIDALLNPCKYCSGQPEIKLGARMYDARERSTVFNPPAISCSCGVSMSVSAPKWTADWGSDIAILTTQLIEKWNKSA